MSSYQLPQIMTAGRVPDTSIVESVIQQVAAQGQGAVIVINHSAGGLYRGHAQEIRL